MGKEVNNFKRLLEEDESRYLEEHQEFHGQHLNKSMNMFRLIGNLFHLFVPHMADSVAMSVGADDPITQSHSSRRDDRGPAAGPPPPSSGESHDPPPPGPKPTDELPGR